MRAKKARINTIVNLLTYIIGMIPNFIVRSILLKTLGNEILGLSSLYTNIISYLSIIELGIGSAIIFSLYKPFAENDIKKIKGYLKYYRKFYNTIAIIIFILGIIMLPILNIFIKNQVNIQEAQIYFMLFLINTILSYLFSYKICILNVDQEGYKVSIATTVSKLIIAFLQIIFLKLYASFFIYLVIQIIINSLYYFCINFYIDKKYKWIISLKEGELENREIKALKTNVKALFFHKIGSLFVVSTDNLVISAFINLKVVGIYNSYYMIISAFQAAIGNALAGVTASIGNLLTTNDSEKAYEIHKKLFFVNFWVVSFVTISLFNTLRQFIYLWLGEDQYLSQLTVNLLLINLYFGLMRVSVEKFKEAAGLYYNDRYAPLIEAIINFVFSILLVNIMGMPGVFLGTFISNFTVVFWVKPKITYKYIFKKPLKDYFNMYFKYMLIALIPLVITNFLTKNIREIINIKFFILNCIINIVVINFIYLLIFHKNKEFLYYKDMVINLIYKGRRK
ncbi:lipopolysaccharide biosynthesis protein [Clostridium perfringens]|uniref:lipopolysaccharide biosynthesis protein n=1 Tax=Clostridium perfringens TaxID=1502 RepID=UPI0039E7602D